MKTKLLGYFLLACASLTGCMDGDGIRWDAPVQDESPYGNNDLVETNVVTIAQLRQMYKSEINTSYSYKQVTEPMQIKGYVTGNDIEGNIYNEVAIQDETGAIIVAVAQGGIFGYLPVGAEVLIELNGLYVGNYGKQAEIGTPYTNSSGSTYVSRMSRALWQQHFKITGNTKAIEPEEFDYNTWSLEDDCGKLGILKNVSIKGATAETTYSDPSGSSSVSLYFNEQPQSVMIYTSAYADFAAATVPQGKCNITGIFKRYNSYWEIIIRSIDDVEDLEKN